ncbi:MAG: DUF3108 domain-containing protein, partial [Deltaproteobacteria bacterium]|nr:DUF3108 domain-containing protein [Deltaproteobacteria bacterium]
MISTLLVAALAAEPSHGPPPMPPDAECKSLGLPRTPFAFTPGELLEFDVDALGAQAGQMEIRTLPRNGTRLPIRVDVRSNTFFSKVRKVTGQATSTLDAWTLRPLRYEESTVEGGMALTADVAFRAPDRSAQLKYTVNGHAGSRRFGWAQDGLDV